MRSDPIPSPFWLANYGTVSQHRWNKLAGRGEWPRYVQGHQGDGSIDRAKPVRRVFRNDHEIALRDSLRRTAFNASPGEIFRVGTGFFDQLASRH